MTSSKMWKFSIQYQSDLDLKSWLNEAQESSGIKRNQLWYKNRGHLTKEQNLVNEKLIEIYNKINKICRARRDDSNVRKRQFS